MYKKLLLLFEMVVSDNFFQIYILLIKKSNNKTLR